MGKGTSKLAPETIEELHTQTGYTEAEIREWWRNFKEDCPNGVLDRAEFELVYQQFFPHGDASKFSQHVFRTFDTDNDGTVNFREFILGLATVSRGSVDSKLQWAFQMYDTDNNGYITKDEMFEIITAIYKMHGEDVLSPTETPRKRTEKLFAKLDANNDNRISLDEFVEGAKNDASIMEMLRC